MLDKKYFRSSGRRKLHPGREVLRSFTKRQIRFPSMIINFFPDQIVRGCPSSPKNYFTLLSPLVFGVSVCHEKVDFREAEPIRLQKQIFLFPDWITACRAEGRTLRPFLESTPLKMNFAFPQSIPILFTTRFPKDVFLSTMVSTWPKHALLWKTAFAPKRRS